MKRKSIVLSVCIILVISVISASLAFSASTPWKPVDKDSYKLLKAGSGNYVVYKTLQDKDKENIKLMISDKGVDGYAFKKDWKEIRKGLISSLNKIKGLGQDDSFQDAQIEDFEITYTDVDGDKLWKFHKVTSAGKAVVIPEEAESLPFEYVSDNNGSEFLLATETGLWRMDVNGMAAKKISKQDFNGKSYAALFTELNSKAVTDDEITGLFWNTNPIFSPDGTKVVYSSNRDCVETGGYSLWVYDLKTGEEKILAKSSGEYYVSEGWLDSNTVLCQRSISDQHTYCAIAENGTITDLNLGNENAKVLCIGSGLIAYTPDNTFANEVWIAKYDSKNGQLTDIFKNKVDGVLRGNGKIDDKGTKYAYLYAPTENDTLQYLTVLDFASGSSTLINKLPVAGTSRTIISDFSWINSNKLFVNIESAINGLMEGSSWIYTLEGGK